LHTLKNEYPAFGGTYVVIHHSQLVNELVSAGRIRLKKDQESKITFHDPCYLGRQNGILDAPRLVLQRTGDRLIEMPRHGEQSFCCGAGGGQMWKEEEHGSQRVNAVRFAEAQAVGASSLAVGCPFCMVMLTDAKKAANSDLPVLDIAELVLAQMEQTPLSQ
jgi:Fe-S oxidoreductase